MTAAHCVDKKSGLIVVLGDHDIQATEKSETRVSVCSIEVHPGYGNSKNIDHDIALVEMCNPVLEFNKAIKPIDLPTKNFELAERSKVHVAGWGLTRERGRVSPVLRVVDVNTVDIDTCRKSYDTVNDQKICAGIWESGGNDSCQGDSGGPLWYEKGDEIVLVGVVSSGRGCARRRYPGIYTKVSVYIDWATKIMQETAAN